ncbi:hypothetical protein EV421DRAFT_1738409 [Armillaria borealis]|uniref:Uncharacterized protein n=1 Tax=Armillaria borealis TaxID=47425 RepID=A0AA39JB06_9AGAR|nr:hypothetical protein EV421DRAFT_1738409 [Armillaria borealis]
MSNTSQPDYEALRRVSSDTDWSLFDDISTSFAAGRKKRDLGFYRYMLSQASLDPSQTTFIGDKPENVFSAHSQRLHGLVYHKFTNLKRALLNLLGDSESGTSSEASRAASATVNNRADNNQGGGQLTTADYVCDMNTASLGPTVIRAKVEIAASVMDEMLKFMNEDGIIQVTRPRIDTVVCVNVLSLFDSYGQGNEIKPTLEWLQPPVVRNRFYPLLKDRVTERIGTDVKDEIDHQTLRDLQCEDGGWDAGLMYRYGSSGVRTGIGV